MGIHPTGEASNGNNKTLGRLTTLQPVVGTWLVFGYLRDPGEGRETGLELWEHGLELWEHQLEVWEHQWEHRLCPAASPTEPRWGWRALQAGGVKGWSSRG